MSGVKTERGKDAVIATVAVGLCAFVAALAYSRNVLLEEWYVRQLESFNETTWRPASAWLVEHGTLRTARKLLDASRRILASPEGDPTGSTRNALVVVPETLRKLVLKLRAEAVPLLVDALQDRSPQPGARLTAVPYGEGHPTALEVYERGEIRIAAATFLSELGHDAVAAIPALEAALKDPDERFQGYVRRALAIIRGQ